jgi:hypothetical protein
MEFLQTDVFRFVITARRALQATSPTLVRSVQCENFCWRCWRLVTVRRGTVDMKVFC